MFYFISIYNWKLEANVLLKRNEMQAMSVQLWTQGEELGCQNEK